jgi:tripartite-type tricarboxylate transporter receptor subunit TctC
MNHVPYRGNGPAMQDLIAGHVDMMFDNLATSGSQINDGALLGLALAAPERSATLPGVPTAKEAALEKFEVSTWYAIWAPKGTSPEVVERMTQEVGKALQTETIRDVWLKNGSDVPSLTGPNLGAFVSSEVIRWRTVIADAGVKLE